MAFQRMGNSGSSGGTFLEPNEKLSIYSYATDVSSLGSTITFPAYTVQAVIMNVHDYNSVTYSGPWNSNVAFAWTKDMSSCSPSDPTDLSGYEYLIYYGSGSNPYSMTMTFS